MGHQTRWHRPDVLDPIGWVHSSTTDIGYSDGPDSDSLELPSRLRVKTQLRSSGAPSVVRSRFGGELRASRAWP